MKPLAHLRFVTTGAMHQVQSTCTAHGITLDDLQRGARSPHVTRARRDAARRLRALHLSFPEIAQAVGYRSHAAAIDACAHPADEGSAAP